MQTTKLVRQTQELAMLSYNTPFGINLIDVILVYEHNICILHTVSNT